MSGRRPERRNALGEFRREPIMNELIQYILDLFSNPGAAQAFVSGPGQAMTDAGLVNVAPDVFSSAVASAMPGVDLGPGDPIGGLQQVLADQYGYDPGYGGYDAGYGGYDQGYGGYAPDPVAAVAEDGAALVADGAGAVLGAVDAGLYGAVDGGFPGYGWQPGWGAFGPGTGDYGPGWDGYRPGWDGYRPGWG